MNHSAKVDWRPSPRLGVPLALRLLIVVGGFALGTLPAKAEFAVCNQTLDVVNVAIGQQVNAVFQTQGWWTIGSNQCATTIREELKNRYIYVFASDVFGQPILEGTVTMCIGPDKFIIDGTESCWQRGHLQASFLEVDTQAVQRWTLFLTDAMAP